MAIILKYIVMKKLLNESLHEKLVKMDKLTNSESASLFGGETKDQEDIKPQCSINLPTDTITTPPNPSYKIKPGIIGITYRF